MNNKTAPIVITDHAMDNYRHRVDKTATMYDLMDGLRRARRLPKDKSDWPIYMLVSHVKKGCMYYCEDDRHVLYITKQEPENYIKVITVIVPNRDYYASRATVPALGMSPDNKYFGDKKHRGECRDGADGLGQEPQRRLNRKAAALGLVTPDDMIGISKDVDSMSLADLRDAVACIMLEIQRHRKSSPIRKALGKEMLSLQQSICAMRKRE